MTDHFDHSIAAFTDALPYIGPRHKTPATVKQYAGNVQHLAAWARTQGRESFAELTKPDLRAFLNSLTGRYGGPASADHRSTVWSSVRSLYRFLEDEEGVKDITGSINVSRVQTADRRVTHLDSPDVDKLVAACRDPRELAVISVCLDAGLRVSELAGLKIVDVLINDPNVPRRLVVTGKGSKTRVVVIGPTTTRALRKYLQVRAKSKHAGLDALWLGERGAMTNSGLYKLICDIGANAGLKIHPHLLRHTFCHFYRLNGGQVDNLAVLCGWSGLAMSMRYGASAAAERAEQEAMGLSLVDRVMKKRP